MTARQTQPQRTKSAKRQLARRPPYHPSAPRSMESSLSNAVALLVLVLTGAGVVFAVQGSPDLWDMWHARARYGAQWVPAGCAR